MKKYAYCAAVVLALGISPNEGTADVASEVSKIAGCDGLNGDDLKKCLAANGVSAGVGQALGIPGFNPSSFFSKARDNAQRMASGAKSFFGGIKKSASNLVYSALGKGDLHAIAEEGGQFLIAIKWANWAQDPNNPFPQSLRIAQTMPDELKVAVQKWRNALMDNGIPASKQANIDALAAMGYNMVVNQTNLTVITTSDKSAYWRKSPWGWLTCSADGKNIVTNGEGGTRVVPIDQINEAIASSALLPMIWIREENRMEAFSIYNCYRLAANNLDGFMQPASQPSAPAQEEAFF